MNISLTVRKTINEEGDAVYEAFIKPKLLSKWLIAIAQIAININCIFKNEY